MKQQTKGKSIIIYLLILAVLFFGISMLMGGQQNTVSYSTVVSCFREERVARFTVDGGNVLTLELTDGTVCRHALADVDAFRQELGPLFEEQSGRGVLLSYDFKQGYTMPTWLIVLLACGASVVLALVIWLVLGARQASQSGGQGGMSRFGQARTVEGGGDSAVTFADVAGAEEESRSSRSWWISSGSPRSSSTWEPASPRGCCWWARRVPARPCWQKPWPGRPG